VLRKTVFHVLFGLLLIAADLDAEESGPPEALFDSLEWKLEKELHEKLVARKQLADSDLSPFATDGCSGGLSVGWGYLSENIEHIREIHGDKPPWESCCVVHDRAYHQAGPRAATSEMSFAARREADSLLRACVIETGAERAPELSLQYELSEENIELLYQVIADLMYRAVRLGGVPCSGLPWRWGYGWPSCE
jgi:hypothetical protein